MNTYTNTTVYYKDENTSNICTFKRQFRKLKSKLERDDNRDKTADCKGLKRQRELYQ